MEDALRRFCLRDQCRKLWTDIICIDMNNEVERAAQVALMGDVYSAAAKTLVWLGRMRSEVANQNTFDCWYRLGDGISILQILLERQSHTYLPGNMSDQYLDDRWSQLRMSLPQYKDRQLLHSLQDIFDLEWWERLWVLQEVALASEADLFWGSRMIKFANLANAYNRLLQQFRDQQTLIHGILDRDDVQDFSDFCWRRMNIAQLFNRIREQILPATQSLRVQSLQMIQILACGRSRETSRAQDKVFGMLGLLNSRLAREFPVSYQATGDEVYLQTALRLLDLSKTFMLFSCIREPWHFLSGWYPKWDYEYIQIQDFYLRQLQEPLFNAQDTAPWIVSVINTQVTPPALQVTGVRLDMVSRVYHMGIDSHFTDSAELYFNLVQFLRLSSDTLSQIPYTIDLTTHYRTIIDSQYVTGIGLLEAVSRTFFNDCEPLIGYRGVQRLTPQNFDTFRNWLLTVDRNDDLTRYNIETIRYAEDLYFAGFESPSMLNFIRSVINGKSFFSTRLGYCGLADKNIREAGENHAYADSAEVWILAGGSQPVVLYPSKQRSGCYYVCSEAYVHGVMDGEAVRGTVPRLDDKNGMQSITSDQPPEFRTITLL